jgi:phosphatidylglycerophosphate synthase
MAARSPSRRAVTDPGWLAASAGLLGAVVPLAVVVAAGHGRRAGLRFAAGAAAAVAVQQLFAAALVAHRRRRAGPLRGLDAVDGLTLARSGAAGVIAGALASGERRRRAVPAWMAWICLLPSVTLLDWIDGPLARRRATDGVGMALDLESDSWVTLWTSLAGVAWGELPRLGVAPTIARYLLPIVAWRRGSYARLAEAGRGWWSRAAGIAQMTTLIVALAPFAGARSRALSRVAAFVIAPAQLLALLSLLVGVLADPERARQDARAA